MAAALPLGCPVLAQFHPVYSKSECVSSPFPLFNRFIPIIWLFHALEKALLSLLVVFFFSIMFTGKLI